MMNQLNLNFEDWATEMAYRKLTYDKSVRQHRFLYAFSILIYLAFAIVDRREVQELLSLFWIIRFGIYAPIALFAIIFTFSKSYQKVNQLIVGSVSTIGTLGMIVLTYAGSSLGFHSYKYGILFALIIITNLTRMRFANAVMISVSLYFVYLMAYLFYPVIPPEVHFDSIILFGVIICLGCLSNYFFEYAQRNQFELVKLLELERDKVSEVNECLEEKVNERTLLLNKTNQTLVEVNEKLGSSEYTFRKLFEESSDAIMLIEEGIIVNINQAMVNLLGFYHKSDLKGRSLWSISVVEPVVDEAELEKRLEAILNNDDIIIQWVFKLKDGGSFLSEIKLTQIMVNGKRLTHMLVRDITERLEMERMLEYLSYHDQLTGLYNRRFFEEELKRMDVKRNLPITIIYADIDGLREINDTFGFNIGDLLIQKVSIAIKAGCRADDLIARIGSDEFAIMLMKADEADGERIINRIQTMSVGFEIDKKTLTTSYGCATKHETTTNIFDVMNEAENVMQRIKHIHKESL
jgi:diguanylate cyclase (GGDEF)-like protein/PAS domain S-box-containing protein